MNVLTKENKFSKAYSDKLTSELINFDKSSGNLSELIRQGATALKTAGKNRKEAGKALGEIIEAVELPHSSDSVKSIKSRVLTEVFGASKSKSSTFATDLKKLIKKYGLSAKQVELEVQSVLKEF